MAPVYANIVMSIFERNLLPGSRSKPLVWFRYIDDNLATWTYDEGKFKFFFLTLTSSIHLFSLPVIILGNVLSLRMSQFL